jgi:autotransporter-associated beta strand protein
MKSLIRKSLVLFSAFIPALSQAVIIGPYTPDANTLHLYHFDETAGGTVVANSGSIGGNAYSVNEAGGVATPPTVTTVLGATAFSGFGNAVSFPTAGYLLGFDANASGAFQGDVSSSSLSLDRINMSALNMGNGGQTPWTIEAMIAPAATNANQEIVCTDSSTASPNPPRGFQFKIVPGGLQFNAISVTGGSVTAPIPSSGIHGFVANSWFHVAATYDGTTLRLYWTAVSSSISQANQIGSLNVGIGTAFGAAQGPLTIGNENRAAAGETFGGKIDEVRISKIARPANGMLFANGVTIVANPNTTVAAPGATASFSVTATTDFGPLSYQWRTNGVPVADGGDFSGSTTVTLQVANAQAAYGALIYDCVVTDSREPADSATTTPATLIVRTPLNLSWLVTPADYNWNSASVNWLDTDHATNAAFTIGDNVTFDDNGGSASPISLSETLAPTSVTFNNSSVAYTVVSGGGKISGGTGLTKSNGGTVTLLSPANDYVGVTTLNGGVVSVTNVSNGGSPSPIGAALSASGNVVLNGGTLQYTGPSASTDRGATLGSNGGTVEVSTAANSLTLSGVLAGTSSGSFTKTGAGTLIFSGANTYDGPTIVSGGTLKLTGGGTFGAGNVTNNSALLFSGSRTIANSIAGTGNVTNDATGTLTLSGVSTYSGQTVINGPTAGGLVVANSGALGNSPLVTVVSTTGGSVGGTRVTLNAGVSVPPVTAVSLPGTNGVRSTLFAAGASSWNGPITLVGDNTLSPGDQLAFAGSGGALTIGGNVTGVNFPGTLQLRGDGSGGAGVGGSVLGTITLAGNATVQVNDGVTWTIGSSGNSWGISEIARGTLQIAQNNALPIGATVRFGGGAAGNCILDLAGFNQQVAALVSAGNVELIGNSSTTSDSTLLYVTNNGTSTFTGSIVDALGTGTRKTALTVAGGTLLLNASNSYSGPTVISAGTLALGANGSISNSTVISIAAGATFDVSAPGSYSLSGSTSLSAAGTGTTVGTTAANIKGVNIDLGSQPIILNYDGSNPALYVSQGGITLHGNAFTINGSPLSAGAHVVLQQNPAGSLNAVGPFPQATGTAIAVGTTNFISESAATLVLNVMNISSTTLTRTIGTSPSTYGTPLRFHAVVSPAPADGETISFFAGATLIGTAATVGGAADLDIANLPASGLAYTITASYPGDTLNTASSGALAGDQVINPATVTPSVAVANKIYDGTTTATITARALAGIVGGDDVNLGSSGTATFASANVGTAVPVSVSALALSGTTAGNYVLASTSISTNADITAATLTYVANPASRAYGAANPTFTGSVTGFVNGEDQSGATTGTLTFTSPATAASAPGTYAIDGSGLTANFGNYTFVQAAANATALTIGPATVTPVVTISNKVYDGTTNATVASRSLEGVIGTDDVALDTNEVAFFASANVATAISVTISNLTLTGSVATNYVLSTNVVTTNADITAATLTYVADPTNRFYATANPDFTGTVIGFVNGENIASATTGTLTFTSPATIASLPGKYPINGSGLTANFGNYVFVQAAGNATALTITFNTSPVSLSIDRIPNSIVPNAVIVSWPSDHVGWRLQVQTNSVTSGIWTDVAGSTTTNQVVFPIDSLTSGMSVYRLVTPTPTFPSGLIANNIDFGGTFNADSFDSSSSLYSTNGRYDPTKRTAHALVASRPGSTGFNVAGTTDIRGFVATGIGGIVTVSGSGIVGDLAYNVKGTIQPGHQTNTFDFIYPPVNTPYGPTLPGVKTPTSGTNASGQSFNYVLNGGAYYATSMVAGSTMFVAADTTLYVAGGTDIPVIYFNTNKPNLTLFFGGPYLYLPNGVGSGKDITFGNSPPQFWLITLPSCSQVRWTGGTFTGVIYGPTMSLLSSGNAEMQGAIVANSFACTGTFDFHSDDAVNH